jgi:hypothetical protein
MPKVLGYWQLPDDERDFFAFLRDTGNIVAVPTYWAEDKADVAPMSFAEFVEQHKPANLHFGLAELMRPDLIKEQIFDGVRRFGMPAMETCEISYSRGKLQSGTLGLSNLSAYLDYPSDDDVTLIKKDETFVKWANRIFNWMRKRTPEKLICNNVPYRATAAVKKAVNSGELQVVLY